MNKEILKQEIDAINVVLEQLASANDTLISYNHDKKDFFYSTVMDYIASARREIKSYLCELNQKMLN